MLSIEDLQTRGQDLLNRLSERESMLLVNGEAEMADECLEYQNTVLNLSRMIAIELKVTDLSSLWGLRAVKSVLVVAGGFKRMEPDLLEEALLMRALRDFNTPKIVREDEVVFFGLLGGRLERQYLFLCCLRLWVNYTRWE
jgi:hypothetical protein